MAVTVLAVWFSKDRALQLSEAIRTFTRYVELPHDTFVRHVVLYACSSFEHARCYACLATALPHITFLDDTCAHGPPPHSLCPPHSHSPMDAVEPPTAARQSHFAAHVRNTVDRSTEPFVWLCVDDVLFVARFSLSAALDLFASSSLLSYCMALHPGLAFHHPTSSPLTVPTFTSPSSGHHCQTPPSLLFAHSSGDGSHDFRYPFSLVATIYRLADVRCIVHDLSRSSLPFHQPNLLESSANRLISTHSAIPAAVRAFLPPPSPANAAALAALRPLSAVPTRPVCLVITVNRVQDVYSNAVYESAEGGVGAMLRRFEAGGWQLDDDRYAHLAEQGYFTSVHVGDLLWKHTEVDNASASR